MEPGHATRMPDAVLTAARAGQYGPVVRTYRTAAGLTLAELGRRCGYSASTLSRLESGRQPLRDIAVLRAIADTLGIPTSLLGLAPPPRPGPDPVRHARSATASRAVAAGMTTVTGSTGDDDGEDPMRRRDLLAALVAAAAGAALADTPGAGAAPGPEGRRPGPPRLATDRLARQLDDPSARGRPVDLHQLRAAVAAARSDFQSARYHRLGQRLPAIVAAAAATRDDAAVETRASANSLFAESLIVASNLMVKINDDVLGLVAADQATRAAAAGDDVLTLADSRRSLATVLRRTGSVDAGQRLVLAAAGEIQPRGRVTPDQLSMYGSLLSVAAYTAAVDGDRAGALDLVAEAGAAASRLGRDANYRFTAFGPTNVALYQVSIAQVLGDCGAAVRHARAVRPSALPTPERQGRYWIDLARAYHRWDRSQQCYRALVAADEVAPAEVRYRPPVHRMVYDLLRTTRKGALPGLPEFASRIGLPAA